MLAENLPNKQNERNIVNINGILGSGFGFAPKQIMRDERLSPEAKALYCYISSFAGQGMQSFPSTELMMKELKMGNRRFYKYRRQLEIFGYITITQRWVKDDEGKIKRTNNLYTLNMYPEDHEIKIVTDVDVENKVEVEIDINTKNEPEIILKKESKIIRNIEKLIASDIDSEQCHFEQCQNEQCQNESVQNNTSNNNRLNNNRLNNNSVYKKNREEKIKEVISNSSEPIHYSSELLNSQTEVKLPLEEFEGELEKSFVKRMKKDRDFKNKDFTKDKYYNAFADAVIKTQVQDNVETLDYKQYAYFAKTLKNMIIPLEKIKITF